MSATEQTETLRELVLVPFRRLGANRVHFALVMPDSLYAATSLGVACTALTSPVKAWCGRTLRGRMVVIPDENMPEWKRQGHVCRECQLVGTAALKLARER